MKIGWLKEPDPQGATPRAEGLETPQEGNAP